MKIKRFILVGVVVLAALVLLVSLLPSRKEAREYHEVTSNVQHGWLQGEDLYFSTGSFFAKYNLATGRVDRLSDYLDIQSGLTEPSWSTTAVVFQTNPQAGDRDDATTAAGQLGVQPDVPHWWRYDFASKQYQLLNFGGIDSCVSVVQVSGTLLACVQPQTADSQANQLTLFNTTDKSTKKLTASDDPISSVSSDGHTIFYVLNRLSGKQSVRSVSLSGSRDKELYQGNGLVSYQVYKNNTVLVNETPANTDQGQADDSHPGDPAPVSSQKILFFKNGQLAFDKTFKSPPVTLYADADGKPLLSSLDGSISSVDEQGLQRQSGPTKQQLALGDFLFKASGKFWVLGADNTLSSSPATSHPKNYRQPSDYDSTKDSDVAGNWWLDSADMNSPVVYLYLDGLSASQQQQAVGDALAKRGFQPSEFNFSWVVDGEDFHAPITPQAIAIQ